MTNEFKVPLSLRIRPNSEAAPWIVEEVKELEKEIDLLRDIIRHLLADRTGAYFICGESGDKDKMGLPEHILVCPSYGAAGTAMYTKTQDYKEPEW